MPNRILIRVPERTLAQVVAGHLTKMIKPDAYAHNLPTFHRPLALAAARRTGAVRAVTMMV
jgi:hypothetical protein